MLLVLANTNKAEIYSVEEQQYALIYQLDHPQSRLKSVELTTDKSGHYQGSQGGHGQFSPPTSAHREEQKQFAVELAEFLVRAGQQLGLQTLVICAEPRFDGLLKQALPQKMHYKNIKHIEKDYIPLSTIKKRQAIEEILHEKV